MEKRLFIAVMISIAFLFAWGALVPRFFPELAKPKKAPVQSPQRSVPGTSPSPQPTSLRGAPETETPVAPVTPVTQQAAQEVESVVETEDYIARFTNRGGQLTSFKLKHYQELKGSTAPVDLVRPRSPHRADYPFAILSTDPQLNRRVDESLYVVDDKQVRGARQLTYRYTDRSGLTVLKTFRFSEPYRFEFAIEITPKAPPYRVILGPGVRALSPAEETDRFIRAGNGVIQYDDSFDILAREKAPKFREYEGKPAFVGLEDNYFLTVLQPEVSGSATFRAIELPGSKEQPKRKELYAGLNAINGRVSGRAFFGPKEAPLLDRYDLEKALQYGVFGFIARILLEALKWLYEMTHNYGWAIIVLTVIIKIILYPLQHKSIVSMKKMQKLQPRMNAIKEKYKKAKSDPEQRQKMNMEMMKLYQQEGISPMSGCLPILLQLPILWAFYSLLSVAIELRGAEFMLWIQDLSAKDPYYITPILMTITMFLQQYLTPTSADPVQRRVFLAMPFIFGWIFKEFPSGLVLYWLVQNILSIIQQLIMNRYWKQHPDEPPEPPKGPPRIKPAKKLAAQSPVTP